MVHFADRLVESDHEVFLVLVEGCVTVGFGSDLEGEEVLENDFTDREELILDENLRLLLLQTLFDSNSVGIENGLQNLQNAVLEEVCRPRRLHLFGLACHLNCSGQDVLREGFECIELSSILQMDDLNR